MYICGLIYQFKDKITMHQRITNITGWLVFAISLIVYYFSVESTGSLWDCGEFILGAYKLQVVHPPGAPLFLLVGRLFAWVGSWSGNPETIAVAVNMLSAICTSFAAMFVCWTTMMLGKLTFLDRETEPSTSDSYALAGAGLVAGLTAAFCTSVWFSAVEGEVYAMSSMFTCMTIWAMLKWYYLPDEPENDRWILFAIFSTGLSIGVHLLSLLTFPALAMFYYFKKYKEHTVKGTFFASMVGVLFLGLTQALIINGIPKLWGNIDYLFVNSFGLPVNSGIVLVLLILGGILYYGFNYAKKHSYPVIQNIFIGAYLLIIGFSTYGMVVIRANVDTPINMNKPDNPMKLIPYLNREQYGENKLLRGPYFDARPVDMVTEPRYDVVDGKYKEVSQKIEYVYKSDDLVFFPRMPHADEMRKRLYRDFWMNGKQGKPSFLDNMSFFIRYQIGWMYWRYFMWNFTGRQNGEQGYFPWDPANGHWISGITPLDNMRLYNQSELPEHYRNNESRNTYFFIPFILGLIGLIYQAKRRREEFFGLLALFIITGIGIIVYANSPPNEPRERDYVLVGSFFVYAMWIGMAVLAIYQYFKSKVSGTALAFGASAICLVAPLLMGFQNFDDLGRRGHYGSRDYANNFLQSCEKNAIIFTYGDNDTYPLWYAQEVEGIRKDVRVVNLSLIAVDWYINALRNKINESDPIKLTIPASAYVGNARDAVYLVPRENNNNAMPLSAALKFIGEDHPLQSEGGSVPSYLPAKNLFIDIDPQKALKVGMAKPGDTIAPRLNYTLPGSYISKDDLAILDVISSNMYERPIYFSVTVQRDKLMGLDDYFQLEGLGLRLMAVKSTSDPDFEIYGSGRVDANKVLENFSTKFKWGGFDKKKMFVDKSYSPSVNAHKLVALRATQDLILSNQNEKAIKLMDTYFTGFPNFNFPYEQSMLSFIRMYITAGAYDKAKTHMDIMAKMAVQNNTFFNSLTSADLQTYTLRMEYEQNQNIMSELINLAEFGKDNAYAEDLKKMFGNNIKPKQNQQGPLLN